jgi:hypothetical protein
MSSRYPVGALAVAFILGLAVGAGAGVVGARWLWPGDDGVRMQTGEAAQANGVGTFEVYYARPFAQAPDLRVDFGNTGFELVEQRPDGFKIRVTAIARPGPTLSYTARGVLADQGKR